MDDFKNWLLGADVYEEVITNKDIVFDTPLFTYSSTVPQKYYTTPTESVEDKYGNVTNYYRGGDTTNTHIIDSYNHTFNTIHNTTNTTNNYSANVKLSDFLNTYTTNTNNYTYNTRYNSWYYDQSTQQYTYDASKTYYNTDNSRYYITIDNSTDEYYMIDVQYSPTFVTVNYDYSTTNNTTTNNYGDVTNVYYFELTDGRNSSTLSASEVAGLDLGYDVANYVLVPDDPNILSLQHFDGNYDDSSSYGRDFYSENRSTNYVDSGDFNGAVQLSSGSAAGVTIPGLSDYESLMFDFRIYYSSIGSLGIYLGDSNIFSRIPSYKQISGSDYYSDHGSTFDMGKYCTSHYQGDPDKNCPYNGPYISEWYVNGAAVNLSDLGYSYSTSLSSSFGVPSLDSGSWSTTNSSLYGIYSGWSEPVLMDSSVSQSASISSKNYVGYETSPDPVYPSVTVGHNIYSFAAKIKNHKSYTYRSTPLSTVAADFSYSTYNNKWVPMRIVLSGGNIYYFVNGDLVGSGAYDKGTFDKFYIKSSGTLYLDELRISTGDVVSTAVYTPSSAPFDTNKVLALPDDLTSNTIYIQHSTDISAYRIGGVRPSAPIAGFFYIPLHDDYTGGQPQLYDGSNWVDINAVVYDGSTTINALGYVFSPVGVSPDVDPDLQPGRPADPGEETDPNTCSHTWEETSRKDATCTLSGSITYTCDACSSTKSESISKLGHSWDVKSSVQTTYDEEGNVVTQGYTIYKCSVCGEEYKDTDGSGPPAGPSDPGEDDSGGNWFTDLLKKIGDFFGTTIGGLLELLGSILNKILDSLIALVTGTLERLQQLVDLFGGFGEALGILWTWLPPEILTVLVSAVTVFIFIALLKLFLK